MKPLKAIFFDLDETLLDDDRAFQIAVASTCIDLAHQHNEVDPHRLRETYFDVSDHFWSELGRARSWTTYSDGHGQAIRLLLWSQALAEQAVLEEAVAIAATELYTGHRRRTYVAYPDVGPVLAALGSRYAMGVITNGFGDTQHEKLAVLKLAPYFPLVLCSGELGIGKPDPAIFQLALDNLGVGPDAAMHVGDSLSSDVAGARAAGITAVWLNRGRAEHPFDAALPHFEIASLDDLLPIVEKLS
jgi:putative hydrolase of the HAD superfamily